MSAGRRVFNIFNNPVFQKWYFNLQGYNKFGLYHDDIYMTSFPEYHEALRRLPPNLYDEFNFRAIRACQLDINKDYLPVNQRPTYEEDMTKGRYLKPYLDEVFAEKQEKEEWEKFMAK